MTAVWQLIGGILFGYVIGWLGERFPMTTRLIAYSILGLGLIFEPQAPVVKVGGSWWPVIGMIIGFALGMIHYKHQEERTT